MIKFGMVLKRSVFISIICIALGLIGPTGVLAADYSPGDPCSASGAFHQTNDTGGMDFLLCDGANWQSMLYFGSAGGLTISSLSGQPAPQYSSSGGSSLWGQTGSDIYFSSGQVGIGTSSPAVALDVVGDINYTGVLTDVSDRREKENITPLSGSLEGILALNGYSFTMKDDEAHSVEYGLIAQDVEPVFPELVKTKPDGRKTLNYVGLLAPMVEAIKSQQEEIQELKSTNLALEARIKKLEAGQ